jgi:DNA-binding HxlR family transcriptional regulator
MPPRRIQVNQEPCLTARVVLDRVGDKWSVMLVSLLGDGAMRFNELRRSIEGISQRMLTLTLRGLERDGLVSRTVYPTIPPRVDYELTHLGRPAVQQARERFDKKHARQKKSLVAAG